MKKPSIRIKTKPVSIRTTARPVGSKSIRVTSTIRVGGKTRTTSKTIHAR